MQVEQAVFTSRQSRTNQGYHLVSRSPGIPEGLAHRLSQFGPTHGSLVGDEDDCESLNYFSAEGGCAVVSRTMYGGPEYSSRGALQVVTTMLVLRHEQLAGYDYNPLAVARVALILGQLRLPHDWPARVPPVALPQRGLSAAALPAAAGCVDEALVSRAFNYLGQRERIALVGVRAPGHMLAHLIDRTPVQERLQLSFATGLKPSQLRPFRLQFLPASAAGPTSRLASLGIRCLAATK
jgi:hypothetical protein